MPWQAHQEMHETIGTYRRSGGTLTGGTYAIQPSSPTDADSTPGFDAAVLADEDCPTTVPAWTQGGYTQMRIAAGGAVAFRTAQSLLVQTGTNYPLINDPNTGAETETANGRYFNCWQILVPATSDAGSQAYRTLILQPQAAYTTVGQAQSEQFAAMNLGTLASLSPEYFAYAKITFRTSSSYTGATGRCRIESVAYLTGSRSGSTTTATGIWEPYLGLPAADGYALVSTAAGARSWEGVVKLAGTETITGAKTFTAALSCPALTASGTVQFTQGLTNHVAHNFGADYQQTRIAGAPTVQAYRVNGTDSVPAAVADGAALFQLQVGGQYDATIGHTSIGADMSAQAAAAWSSTSRATRWVWSTCTGTETTPSERMRLTDTGGLSIGTTLDPGAGKLVARAVSVIRSTVSDTGNIVALSSDDGFIRMIGAAPVVQGIVAPAVGGQILYIYCGNATTLKHQDTAATAANRIFSSTGADISVAGGKTVQLIYDNVTLRWRDVRY
jgi:hypothetical protein